MRNLILISVLLNLALASAIGYGVMRKKQIAQTPWSEKTAAEPVSTERPSSKTEIATSRINPVETETDGRFTWRQIESGDYKAYIANLRSVNCPEETIADIIIAEVNKLFRPRLEPYRERNKREFKFWLTGEVGRYQYTDGIGRGKRDPEHEKA